MKKSDLIFGIQHKCIEKINQVIQVVLGIRLESHHSIYRGGVYYNYENNEGESIIVQHNREFDDEIAEEQYPNLNILVIIEGTDKAEFFKMCMTQKGFVLLRENTYDIY